jgi:ribosomal protein S18 acetylase RimI-like enzyme
LQFWVSRQSIGSQSHGVSRQKLHLPNELAVGENTTPWSGNVQGGRRRRQPIEPHGYLPPIRVDPAHQRKGYGSMLLHHALSECDWDHVAAYLESSNPANVLLYQRHGFEVLDTIQVGSSPPIFPMLRPAR